MNDLLVVEFSQFLEKYSITYKNYNLSKREQEVVFLINKGLKNRVIGETLYISETTVKKHVYNIFNKCNLNSRFELICHLRTNTLQGVIETAC